MAVFQCIFMVFYFVCAITPIFGQIFVLTVMIRSKLIRDNDNSYLMLGVLSGDFLICLEMDGRMFLKSTTVRIVVAELVKSVHPTLCKRSMMPSRRRSLGLRKLESCATLWQFALSFIDPPTKEPFLTKGQSLLMEVPNIAGIVISQIATVSLAVDRMNSLRNHVAYYQKNHFKSARIWWVAEGLLGLVTAAMPQIANDVGTVIHYTEPTWPRWFRWYWMGFSIIVSTVVLLAYLLVIVYSRTKIGMLEEVGKNRAYNRRTAREKVITKTVMRVLTIYILFWGLPSIVYNTTVMFKVNLGPIFGLLIMIGSVFCAFANVIFLLMREDIRRGVRLLFGCKQQELHSTSGNSGQRAAVSAIAIVP